MSLTDESERATARLAGKVAMRVVRHRETEVMIEFADGTRFFADSASPVELSITL